MPSKKISQLPGAAPLTGVELLAAVQSGGDVAITPAQLVAHLSAPVTYNTLSAFQAAKPPAGVPVTVRARTGTWPPASGLDATPLTYRPIATTTGLFGEITVNGQLYAPVYSTSPVLVGEFGVVGDSTYTEASSFGIIATSDGTTTVTVNQTTSVAVGMNAANVSWHSFAAAAIGSAGVIPAGTTVVSFVPGVSITLSNAIVAASNFNMICWSETLTGTDNTVAIQAALNFAMQNGYTDVKMPNGRFMTSDTLNMGWGEGFHELHLIGTKRGNYGGSSGGSAIYSSKVDRPVINIAGGRLSSITGMTFVGRNRFFAEFSQAFTNILSSDPLDWFSPNYNPTGNNPGGIQSTAPYAAITIDAYSGAAPTIAYPNRTFPSWTGLVSNYNNNFQSSDTLIDECDIQGFGVGFVAGLVTNIQGDFIKLHNLVQAAGPYGISINNTQSRNVEIRNMNYAYFHTYISSTNLGQGQGEMVGPFDNIGGGASYQTFDMQNMGFTGSMFITSLYFENQVRLGNFVANQAFSSHVVLQGGTYQFQLFLAHTQMPKSYITSGPFGCITMNGVTLNGGPRISNLITGGGALFVNGGPWSGAVQTNTSTPLIQAVNYSGGFLLGDVRFGASLRTAYSVKNLLASNFQAISGGQGSQTFDDEISFHNSLVGTLTRTPMTQCAKFYVDTFGRRWKMSVTPEVNSGVGTFASGPTYSNDQMSFSWPAANQTSANVMQNLAVGDMLYHVATGTIFVITVIGAPTPNYPITTIQQNNLIVNTSNVFVQNINPDPTLAAGNIIIIKTGAVIPSVLEYGTFTSGNANVASISDGSGTSHMASNYVNGDFWFGLPTTISGSVPYRQWPVTPGSVLSAVTDGSPGSLTMSKNALASGVFPLFPYELY